MDTSLNNTNFKVLSLNIRGLNQEKKRRSLFKWLKVNDIKICFLQETYSTSEVENRWRNEWGGKAFFVHGTNHARGVTILFKPGLDVEIVNFYHDDIGRVALMEAKIQGTSFKLVNIYAPNSEDSQLHFYGYLKNFMNKYINTGDKILLGGDFNVIINPNLDRKGGCHESTLNYKKIINIINSLKFQFELTDVWRQKNPGIRRYTWRKGHPKPVFSRLDYWFISENLFDSVENVDILPSFRSDHSGILIHIKGVYSKTRGRGYWRLNNTYLDDAEYISEIIKHKDDWMQEINGIGDNRMKWEYIKYKVRGVSIAHGKKRAKERRDKEKEMESKLQELEQRIDASVNVRDTNALQNEIIKVKAELSEVDNYKTEGLILRSRARWHEKGEKSNAYFLKLESRNKIKKSITKLQRSDGTYITDPNNILAMQRDFYDTLYTSRQNKSKQEIEQYLKNVQTPKLNEDDRSQCEGELTIEESYKALNSFAKNKAPGNDGLTMEFYKKFWPIFGKLLVNSLNESFRLGELSTSQKQAVITLLDKGKDRNLLKNWRPISLLNTDYKIATKVLSNRLKSILPKLIHPDQVGYVQGRNIAEALRTLQDIMAHTKLHNLPGILICIDFEKAFDSLEWNFLDAVLDKYNFGPSFKKWINTIYKDISSCIKNNGTTSKQFTLGRGVRQGDPLSPYLFILAVEILSNKIRQNKDITGITINNEEIKLQQYADDTTGILQNIESAKCFLSEVKTFGLYSGLKLNKEKTEGLWLGSNSENINAPLGISWPTKPLRILGVYHSYNTADCNKYNFEEKINNTKSVMNLWKMRNLTILGRIQIVKTFIISKFLYTCSVISTPQGYIKEINRIIYNFIWKSRTDKLKRSIMVSNIERGGLKTPDLQLMIDSSKINWIRRYLSPENHVWKATMKSFFVNHGIDFDVLLQSNFKGSQILKTDIPDFYKEMLRIWSEIGQTEPFEKDVFLWYNQNITINKRPVFYPEFYQLGMKHVKDLYDGNSKLISFSKWARRGLQSSHFMKWAGLISAVSKFKGTQNIVQETQEAPSFVVTVNKVKHPVNKVNSKLVYEKLVELKYGEVVTIPKIVNFIDEPDEIPVSWETVYKTAHRSMDTGTRAFQFKFLHNILVNNYWLCKWKIRDDTVCDFCHEREEDIGHLYWDCVHVTRFWNSFKAYYGDKLNASVLTKNLVFLGTQDILLCGIIFAAKRHIYQSKFKNVLPCFQSFVEKVKFMKQTEFHIAKTNNTVNLWIEKWERLL